jgi:hypothetical protein
MPGMGGGRKPGVGGVYIESGFGVGAEREMRSGLSLAGVAPDDLTDPDQGQ